MWIFWMKWSPVDKRSELIKAFYGASFASKIDQRQSFKLLQFKIF